MAAVAERSHADILPDPPLDPDPVSVTMPLGVDPVRRPGSVGTAMARSKNLRIDHLLSAVRISNRKVIGGDDLPTNCMCPVTSLRLTAGQTTKPPSKGKARRGGNRPSRAVRLWMLLSLPSARFSRFSWRAGLISSAVAPPVLRCSDAFSPMVIASAWG